MDCDLRVEWILLFKCCHSVYSTISLQSNGQTVNDFSSVFFRFGKVTGLGRVCCVALPCCFLLFDLGCFFLTSFCISHVHVSLCILYFMCTYVHVYIHIHCSSRIRADDQGQHQTSGNRCAILVTNLSL